MSGRNSGTPLSLLVYERFQTSRSVLADVFAFAPFSGETADISGPLAHHARFESDRAERGQPWYWWIRIMGRLRPGVTAAAARASLEPVFQLAAREDGLPAAPSNRHEQCPTIQGSRWTQVHKVSAKCGASTGVRFNS